MSAITDKTIQVRVDSSLFDNIVSSRLGGEDYNGNMSKYVRSLIEHDLNGVVPGHLSRLREDINRGFKYIVFLILFLSFIGLCIYLKNYLFFINVLLCAMLFCMVEIVKISRKS